jgi:hypothetical protein
VARGFESKSVEFQQEEAQRGRQVKPGLTPEQKADRERRETLALARARALADLSRATAPAHRRMLEQAIEALDANLKTLKP